MNRLIAQWVRLMLFAIFVSGVPLKAAGTDDSLPFNHYGFLAHKGQPYDGIANLRFELYFDGRRGYTEEVKVTVDNGYYSSLIGRLVPAEKLGAMLRESQITELVVVVLNRGREYRLEPPQRLYPAPLAFGVVGEAIGAENLQRGSVNTETLAPRAVSEANLADDSVSARTIRPRSIRAQHIGLAAVTAGNLRTNSVTGDAIQNDSVTGFDIADGSISYDHLQTTAGLLLRSRIYSESATINIGANGAATGRAYCRTTQDILLTGSCINTSILNLSSFRTIPRSGANAEAYECTFFNSLSNTQSAEVTATCLTMALEP